MNSEVKNFWKNPFVIICIAAIGYWVYTYHFEHAMGVLPYAILLLCPLMHIFGHGHGHGHGHDHNKHSSDGEEK